MAEYSNYWRILGLLIFTILWPANVRCDFIAAVEQTSHGIAPHIRTEPSTVTVPEITRGEVGSTSGNHIAPMVENLVATAKTKEEHQVHTQKLIAKIPQLRHISTIQARNGMGLGFWISLPEATVEEARKSEDPLKKDTNLSKMINHVWMAIKSRKQTHDASGEHLQVPSGSFNLEPVINQSKLNPQAPTSSNENSKDPHNVLNKMSKESTIVSSGTETEAQTISHLDLDSSITQEVMKWWNRGIIKDLKELHNEFLSESNQWYSGGHEAGKRLIFQTVDLLYKHQMIDVDWFKSFYDTDQIVESTGKNMVWYFMYSGEVWASCFSWNIKFYLNSWYSSHSKNMYEVLDQKQKLKFEYAALQYLLQRHVLNCVGTVRWYHRSHTWYQTLFQENVEKTITLYKYLEKHFDNDPTQALGVQEVLIEMIEDLNTDGYWSNIAHRAKRRIGWRMESQILAFIQDNYEKVFLEIPHTDNQLGDKLILMKSSNELLGKLENIMIYLKEYFPHRGLWESDLELKQPMKNSMTRLEELSAISTYIDMIHEQHNQNYSDIKLENPLEPYLQREDVDNSIKSLKRCIKNHQELLTIGRGEYWCRKCLISGKDSILPPILCLLILVYLNMTGNFIPNRKIYQNI
ncbi:hypothetical protein PSHT_01056, partial [Puccinia striiformis]